MWKVCMTMEEANAISKALNGYLSSLSKDEADKKFEAANIKAMLDDRIQVVQTENKLVQDYIDSIKKAERKTS